MPRWWVSDCFGDHASRTARAIESLGLTSAQLVLPTSAQPSLKQGGSASRNPAVMPPVCQSASNVGSSAASVQPMAAAGARGHIS